MITCKILQIFLRGSRAATYLSLGLLIAIAGIFGAGLVEAQETIQIDRQISQLLIDKKAQIPIPAFLNNKCYANGEIVNHPGGPLICAPEYHDIRVADYLGLTTSPIKDSPLPVSGTVVKYLIKNCTPEEQKIVQNVTESKTVSTTVVNSENVSVSTNSSVKGTIGLKTSFFNASAESNSGQTTTDAHSTGTTDTSSSSTTIEVPRTYTVPAWKILSVKVTTTHENSYYDVKGDVVVEADVFVRLEQRYTQRLDPHVFSVGLLSDFLPLEKDRAITLNAQVWTIATTGTVEDDEILDCPTAPTAVAGQGVASAPAAAPASGSAGVGAIIAKYKYGLGDTTASDATQITAPIVDGMDLTTADVVGNVDVRAKSAGPGFCSVGVSSPLGSAQILAPPGVWSEWTNLFSHLSKVTTQLGTSVDCDTGAQFEVRYWH